MCFRAFENRKGSAAVLGVAIALSTMAAVDPIYAQPEMDAAVAAPVDAVSEAFDYRIIRMSLSQFLTMLADDAQLRLSMPTELSGVLVNTDLTGNASDILRQLSRAHDLDWFEFNGVYHVAARSDATTRLIPVDDMSIAQARSALERSGLNLDGKHINTAANETALAVYGAPSFIGIVEAILTVTPGNNEQPAVDKVIRVRRGNVFTMEYLDDANRTAANQRLVQTDAPTDADAVPDNPGAPLNDG